MRNLLTALTESTIRSQIKSIFSKNGVRRQGELIPSAEWRGADGTQVSLWLQPLKGKARKLSLGAVSPTYSDRIAAAVGPKGEIAFPGTTVSSPSELYYMASPTDPPKQLTNFNHEIVSDLTHFT